MFKVKVMNGMIWRRHVNQVRKRTSVVMEPQKNMELEESFLGFPMSVPTSDLTVSSSPPVLPATHGTSIVRRSTRERHPPNRLLPGYTF